MFGEEMSCVACGVTCYTATEGREFGILRGRNFLSRAAETDSVASPFYFLLYVEHYGYSLFLHYRTNVLLPDPQASLLACDLKNSMRCRSIDFKYHTDDHPLIMSKPISTLKRYS
jgi:hypothetical protein